MQNHVAVICHPMSLLRYYPLLKDCGVKGKKHKRYCRITIGLYIYMSWFIDAWLIPLSLSMWGLHQRFKLNSHWIYHSVWACTCTCVSDRAGQQTVTNARMSRHTWESTPTFIWNSKFSSIANMCSNMSSAMRGMMPIPWGSWRFPYDRKEER